MKWKPTENLTVIREMELVDTSVEEYSAVYVGDARCPLAEARICAAKLSEQAKPKFLLIDIGRKPDQDIWELITAVVQKQLHAPRK